MKPIVGVPDSCFPQLMSIAYRSPLNRWMQAMTAPRKPSDCTAVRRRGPGGAKLTRVRQMKKWFKCRPHTSFPKGAVSRKLVRAHMTVNWMYYTKSSTGQEPA